MPLIDVDEVLLDPDIAGEVFQVIRRTQTVGSDGIAVATEAAPVDAVGALYPTGSNSLAREEAYETQSQSVRVVTSFRLRTAGRASNNLEYLPDHVVWRGSRYLVKSIDDFTSYGAGFVVADCVGVAFDAPVRE